MKRFRITAVFLVAALIVAMIAAGCGSQPSADDVTTAETVAETPQEATEAAVKAPSSFDGCCLDEFGNPTLYAVTELTGPELVTLLEEQGYEWEEKDEILRRFLRTILLPGETISQQVTLTASDKMYEDIWPRENYDNATDKGGVAVRQTNFIVAGYADPTGEQDVILEDVIKAIVNIEIVDQYYREDVHATMLVVKDSRGMEYAVIVQSVGPGRTDITMNSEEVYEAGGYGMTIADDWAAFTGEASYGE